MPDNSLTSLQFLRVCPASTTTKVALAQAEALFCQGVADVSHQEG